MNVKRVLTTLGMGAAPIAALSLIALTVSASAVAVRLNLGDAAFVVFLFTVTLAPWLYIIGLLERETSGNEGEYEH